MAHECRARPGESYEFVPAEEPEPEPAPAPRQMEPSRTKKMSIHQGMTCFSRYVTTSIGHFIRREETQASSSPSSP